MTYGIYEDGVVIARFVTPTRVTSNKPVYASDTVSLKRKTFGRSAQRWEIETNLFPLVEDANKLFVNLVTRGQSEAVQVITPQNYGVILKRTYNIDYPPVSAGLAGSDKVTVGERSNTNPAGTIPTGCFIKFNGHDKVYMTTRDFEGGELYIFPRLLTTVTGGFFKWQDDVVMQCLYDTDSVIGMVYSDGIMMDAGTVKLVEKL